MANIINAGEQSKQLFSGMLNTVESAADTNYFRGEYEKLVSSIGNIVSDVGTSMANKAVETYNNINSSAAMNTLKRVLMDSGVSQDGYVLPYLTIEEIQMATPYMQRWVMANPNVKRRFNQQTAESYDGMFIGNSDIGEDCYDYRRVTEGMVMTPVDSEYYHYTHYIEDLDPTDKELTLEEQGMILDTWSMSDLYMLAGMDPTSPTGNLL